MKKKFDNEILNTRQASYGTFEHNATLIQAMNVNCRQTLGWERLTPDKRQAIDMILTKIGRIVTGDPDHKDSWDDISGYAQLISEALSPS